MRLLAPILVISIACAHAPARLADAQETVGPVPLSVLAAALAAESPDGPPPFFIELRSLAAPLPCEWSGDYLGLELRGDVFTGSRSEKVFRYERDGRLFVTAPGDLPTVQRPGLTFTVALACAEENLAGVIVEYWCGILCGGSGQWTFKRVGGAWKLIRGGFQWVS